MSSQSRFEDIPILSILCLTSFLLPLAFLTSAFDVFGTVKYTLLIFLAILALGTQAWLTVGTGKITLPGGRLALILFLFLVWMALATFFSPIAAISFFGLRKRLLGLTTYLAAAALLTAAARVSWDKKKLTALFYSLSSALFVSVFIGVRQFYGSTYPFDLKTLFNRAAYSTFGNPDYFGLFLALMAPITILLALRSERLRDRVIGCAGIVAVVLGLAVADSSGAWLGAVTGSGILLGWYYIIDRPDHFSPGPLEVRPKTPQAGQNWRTRPKAPDARLTKSEMRERMCDYVTEPRARKTPQTGFSAALLGALNSNWKRWAAVAVTVIVFLGFTYAASREKTAIDQRAWIWSAGARVAAKYPLIGTGPENLKSGIYQLGIEPEEHPDEDKYEDAHNIWLTTAATAGLPALALLVAFLTLTASGAIKAQRNLKDRFLAGVLPALLASGVAYLLTAQFNPEDIGSLPIFWILAGVTIALSGGIRTVKFNVRPTAHILAAGFSLLLLGAAVFSMRPLTAEVNLLRVNNSTDVEAGRVAFKSIQRLQPWQTHYYLFEIYRFVPVVGSLDTPMGRELAQTALEAVTRNPNDTENWLAYGELYRSVARRRGDNRLHRTALDLFKRAATIEPFDARAIRLTALTYGDLNDRKNSLKWIARYERYFSDNAELVKLKNTLLNSKDTKSPAEI